jgi:hypothetical protein
MILALVGVGVILVTLVDVHITTISMRGGGPVSLRITRLLWRPAARSTRVSHRVLEVYGSLMLPLTIALWYVLLYGGWALVFFSHPSAVLDATTGVPAQWWERLYFVGYVISTLGNGELRPGAGMWQLLTVAASVSGLALITLAITYITPVMSSVVHKRQVASSMLSFGETPADILGNAWNGNTFEPLTIHLTNLAPSLSRLAQQHMAYPILHYFHSAERSLALAPAIAVLDDALTLLRFGVADSHRLEPVTLGTAVAAVDTLLTALEAAHIDPADAAPAPPPLAILDRLGIPGVPEDAYDACAEEVRTRRALLLGFVESDGWSWAK